MKIKSLFGLIAGGITAITGFALMGCEEDSTDGDNNGQNDPAQVGPTDEDLAKCCGDKDSLGYKECIEAYKKDNVCANHSTEKYGPIETTKYGPLVPDPNEDEIAKCCGKEGSEGYDKCVENYNKTKTCDPNRNGEEPTTKYGPLVPSDEEIAKCCGKEGSDGYEKCVKTYKEEGVCINESTEKYGPIQVGPTDEQIKKCCGDKDSDGYDKCVEEYKKTNICPNQSTIKYGPQNPTE